MSDSWDDRHNWYAPTMEREKTDEEKLAEIEYAFDPPVWFTMGPGNVSFGYGTIYGSPVSMTVTSYVPTPVPHAKLPKNKKRYEPSKRDQFRWQNSQTNRKLSRLKRR